jgi:hypothetical protein
MQRHPSNRNLSIHYGETFEGLPIMVSKGPFIYEHLKKLKLTIERALVQYPRVFAFRCDLRFPTHVQVIDQACSNAAIGAFMESFKAQIESNRNAAARLNPYAHTSEVRYVWAREQGQGSRVHHYHLLILLNQDAFYTVGRLGSENSNMFHRLEQAWAYALKLPVAAVQGLVEVPFNAEYRIHRNDAVGQAALFERASYLCKEATKPLGNGYHVFDCSRN